MKYIYSKHIKQRMEERNISLEEVEYLLFSNENILIIPSKQDKEIDLMFGQIRKKHLMIAVNRDSGRLVTVRPMRNNEKKLLKEVCGE